MGTPAAAEAGPCGRRRRSVLLLRHVAMQGTRNWGSLKAAGVLPSRDQKACCNRFILLRRKFLQARSRGQRLSFSVLPSPDDRQPLAALLSSCLDPDHQGAEHPQVHPSVHRSVHRSVHSAVHQAVHRGHPLLVHPPLPACREGLPAQARRGHPPPPVHPAGKTLLAVYWGRSQTPSGWCTGGKPQTWGCTRGLAGPGPWCTREGPAAALGFQSSGVVSVLQLRCTGVLPVFRFLRSGVHFLGHTRGYTRGVALTHFQGPPPLSAIQPPTIQPPPASCAALDLPHPSSGTRNTPPSPRPSSSGNQVSQPLNAPPH